MNISENYVGILVSTISLVFNELFIQFQYKLNPSIKILFSQVNGMDITKNWVGIFNYSSYLNR